MENNITGLPSVDSFEPLHNSNGTGRQSNLPVTGGTPYNKSPSSLTKIVEIISLIGGVFVILGFIISIIITQNNIINNVTNLSTNIQNYQNDNVVIKTQIENWFNKIDTKLDDIKDEKKK